jgi:hypothetical protein
VSDERDYPSMAEMPEKITALSTLSTRDLEEVGARTGFSAFHAGPGCDPFLSG